MGNKKVGKGGKILLHVLQHCMAVIAAICFALITQYAYFRIILPDGTDYSTMMYPWEAEENYEDTYIFSHYLRGSIQSTVRMAVIKSQMETDGAYDGSKKIDIYEYVNRRNDRNFSQNIKAEYYLEDLIKWNEYGFTYEELPETSISATHFFDEAKTSETEIEKVVERAEEGAVQETQATDSNRNTAVTYITIEEIEAGTNAAVEGTESTTADSDRPVLTERYQSADGKNITDFVTDWDAYDEFCQVLQDASSQVATNYYEYRDLNLNYSADNTNLRYCIQIPGESAGKYEYFTNENLDEIGTDITAHFRNYGKYLYYYPKHMEIETNTFFSEYDIRSHLNQYEYFYPENTRIWIAIDTTYPVQDFLWQNKIKHDSFMPYYILCLGILAASALIYLILWVYLTIKAGKPCKTLEDDEETTIILYRFDRIPSELVVLMAVAVGIVIGFGGYLIAYLVYYESIQGYLFIAGTVLLALAASCCAMLVYYSMIRRIKAHVFWKYTLIAGLFRWVLKILKKIGNFGKRIALSVYNDSNILVRVVLPYLLFLAVNGVLVIWTIVLIHEQYIVFLLPIVLLMVFDIAVAVLRWRENRTRKQIVEGIEEITKGNLRYQIELGGMYGDNLVLARAVNSIGDGIRSAVETSMKDERLKADLITNVSHDIKTPLTSIINYVDLIKRENIEDEKIKGYVEILDNKSQRLKQLTEDLVEASKISSGNIEYHLEIINFVELIHQTLGEFSAKFEEKDLTVIAKFPEEAMPIMADSRRIWRVIENLYNNIYKYAMPGTRVYMDMVRRMEAEEAYVSFAVKNISARPLNINADELTERFIRGDVSRSTEGSGLGLSIAKNLTQAQNGSFTIYLDGDLFKVILEFPLEKE